MTMTYEQAKAWAQQRADETGFDYGVEKEYNGYGAFMLPQYGNRYGHETRCEVVHCTVLAKCQPGHGPIAKQQQGRGVLL